jgi:hypothetical protein
MIPVDMLVKHDPQNGVWGDCTRACVASIFELPADQVPHFCNGGEEPPDAEGVLPWERRLRAWLRDRGFTVMHFRIDSHELDFDPRVTAFHHVRGGRTPRGTNHDTVWFGRNMVHDPHPSRIGILQDVFPQSVMVFVKL